MDERTLRIGEVARAAGVRTSLIRYYETIGLLPAAPRVSRQRRYDPSVLCRLALIDVAQRAGRSLDEIRELLEIGSARTRSRRGGELWPSVVCATYSGWFERTTQMRAWLHPRPAASA